MSAGAVFKLIANDGKADRMIMATELTYTTFDTRMLTGSEKYIADSAWTHIFIIQMKKMRDTLPEKQYASEI